MEDRRIYFSVFLGIVVIFASYYISQVLFSPAPRNEPAVSAKITSSGNVPKFSELSGGVASTTTNLTNSIVHDLSSEFYTKTAALDEISRDDLLTQIKSGNEKGLEKIITSEQVAAKLTPDVIGIRSEISDDEIKSDPKNDIDAYKKKYKLALSDLESFSLEYDLDEMTQTFMKRGDVEHLGALVEVLRNTHTALKEIPVPDVAREFHKENILYFSNAVIVYSAVQNYAADPLRAYVALQYSDSFTALWKNITTLSLKI